MSDLKVGGAGDDGQIFQQMEHEEHHTGAILLKYVPYCAIDNEAECYKKWHYHSKQSYLKISKRNILLVNIYFVKIKLICYMLFSGLI